MLVLGIETSCDETAVALVEDGIAIRGSVVHSQTAAHARFGGVVPDLAAREHVAHLVPVLSQLMERAPFPYASLDAIAVTDSPGLAAALLCGVAAAEALGLAHAVPVIGVNHVEAHLVAPFLAQGRLPRYPLLSLVVSGGHTHLFRSTSPSDHVVIGATLDDAAGEAFDKVAKMLGLSYPGGPAIERAARTGRADAFPFRRPRENEGDLDFSFSGLKTAVLYRCFGQDSTGRPKTALPPDVAVADVAASFQEAVVDSLAGKLARAVERTGIRQVGLGGGVACNQRLRRRLADLASDQGFELLVAPPALCTDNAAMVAARGTEMLLFGLERPVQVRPRAVWPRESMPQSIV